VHRLGREGRQADRDVLGAPGVEYACGAFERRYALRASRMVGVDLRVDQVALQALDAAQLKRLLRNRIWR
jgi:hypothetical protein